MTEETDLARALADMGCDILMPWGAPIGSARGLNNVYGLRMMRARFPDTVLIVDAGLGVPSHAAQAMELGGASQRLAGCAGGCPSSAARRMGTFRICLFLNFW
jgi:thiazole synthase